MDPVALDQASRSEQMMALMTVVNFDQEETVCALGALLQYLAQVACIRWHTTVHEPPHTRCLLTLTWGRTE